jgi:hypothetical protein
MIATKAMIREVLVRRRDSRVIIIHQGEMPLATRIRKPLPPTLQRFHERGPAGCQSVRVAKLSQWSGGEILGLHSI